MFNQYSGMIVYTRGATYIEFVLIKNYCDIAVYGITCTDDKPYL